MPKVKAPPASIALVKKSLRFIIQDLAYDSLRRFQLLIQMNMIFLTDLHLYLSVPQFAILASCVSPPFVKSTPSFLSISWIFLTSSSLGVFFSFEERAAAIPAA